MQICFAMKGADFAIEPFILSGKYRMISVLGSGSFGTVYLAEHLKLKIFRAIKCIPRNTAETSSFSLDSGFPMEAELLKNLNHPGIPLIYDIDEDDDFIYMVEEYIQGESLDTFVLHPRDISPELILKIGIQLCDILDYLHHLSPYPILYQDLKPEHIILCGNQVKLIDFGIASFFTGSGNYFQLYGTKEFSAPEALSGQPVTTAADIFGLGKILKFLADAAGVKCSRRLLHIIQCACDPLPDRRYLSVSELKLALLRAQKKPRRQNLHLIRNIAVLGSRPGAGATHIAISLVCTLQNRGIPALYQPADGQATLDAIAVSNRHVKEQDGIFYYRHFKGVPDYGDGVSLALPFDDCIVRDYGTQCTDWETVKAADCILLVLSGSDWDISAAKQFAKQLALLPQTVLLCNHGNRTAAKRLAKQLDCAVYCFPSDADAYSVTSETKQLFSLILKRRGGLRHFSL